MAEFDIGGLAFPSKRAGQYGMTLRDYFAGQALVAVALADLGSRLTVQLEHGHEDGGLTDEQIAACAYMQADAMLKEREKN